MQTARRPVSCLSHTLCLSNSSSACHAAGVLGARRNLARAPERDKKCEIHELPESLHRAPEALRPVQLDEASFLRHQVPSMRTSTVSCRRMRALVRSKPPTLKMLCIPAACLSFRKQDTF